MEKIKLIINGINCEGEKGQTILAVAKQNGIDIPTLCHDERVEIYASCGICVVEIEGNPRLLRSCSTVAADGMVVKTDTPRIFENRKAALELLLSDHTGDCRPPCTLACPAQTDCQGYVGLIANGEYEEALKQIKDKIPLPASIGRVCPHPCEDACRRKLVEEPVSIAALKQFAGDLDLKKEKLYLDNIYASTGKKVGIIGGGPGGLSAAYFLRLYGHEAAIYDAMPLMGGMLRYGIPQYRLPKDLLQKEIDCIESMGVEFKNNVKIGKDISLDSLKKDYDAVVIATGAWTSTALRCKGEDLDGVQGGIEFLKNVDITKKELEGQIIAVVGGGNTAMDACRTAVRLGAKAVYNIYRRTINEMPAEEIEIIEAQEEGVIFKNLTNPIEIEGKNGRVSAVRLQIMELGEPDASGRRSPIPIEGKEETIEIDKVIVAIGQKSDNFGFGDIEKTKWNTIAADEMFFTTNIDGVFAIGDVTNNGADIAITAIGEAKKAAVQIDRFLNGEKLSFTPPYIVKTEKTAEDFADKQKEKRLNVPHRCANERKNDFLEVNLPISEDDAVREAARCLECGCLDFFECKLIKYADMYDVKPEKYSGEIHRRETEKEHPFIRRNPDKCILCGLCVRICDETVGATALGLYDRGFETVVKPALDADLRDTDCISCGSCANVCPTGALMEKMMIKKQLPIKETMTETVCAFCSVGCKTVLATKGNMITRSLPSEPDGLLCKKGRFGFGMIFDDFMNRSTEALISNEKSTMEKAFAFANGSLIAIQKKHSNDSIAVSISDRYTNEDALAIKEYANNVLNTENVFSFNQTKSGLADVLGRDASTASIDDMKNAELFVVIGSDIYKNHGVAAMKIKKAVNSGAKLIMLSNKESLLDGIAMNKIKADDLSVLKQIASSLNNEQTSEEAAALAKQIKDNKTVIIFEKSALTTDAARMIANISLLAEDCKILQLLPGANSQGLINMGIKPREEFIEKIKSNEIRGLFIFGENVDFVDFKTLDFLAVQDLYDGKTNTTKHAKVVFPAKAWFETGGTYTSAIGITQELKPVTGSKICGDLMEEINKCRNADRLARKTDAECRNVIELNENVLPSLMPVEANELYAENVVNTNILCEAFMNFADKSGCK